MDYLISFVLGIVEGLTEFLPVSSTAHLRLAQDLFHLPLNDPFWKMYAIVIQLGAILCLPVYFLPRITKHVRTFPKGELGKRTIWNHPLSLVMIAFVVTAGPAFLLKKSISANLESVTVMGAALLIGGAIMWAVDSIFGPSRAQAQVDADARDAVPLDILKPPTQEVPAGEYLSLSPKHHRTERIEEMSIVQAIWIGAMQILSAVFPGTSRSMSTIAAGQVAGMNRSAALEFSFFLSIPTMAVATLYDLLKTLHPGKSTAGLAPLTMDAHRWIVLLIGFVVSFIIALAVVAWFMNWVRRRGFAPFAIYRIIVGLTVLILARNGKL